MVVSKYSWNEYFLDFIECEYKAFLKIKGYHENILEYDIWKNEIQENYRSQAVKNYFNKKYNKEEISQNVLNVTGSCGSYKLWLNIDIIYKDICLIVDAIMFDKGANNNGINKQFVPIFLYWKEKIAIRDKLYMSFVAEILSRYFDIEVAKGVIVYGERCTESKLTFKKYAKIATNYVDKFVELKLKKEEPRMFLNKNCQICEFKYKCFEMAKQKDDLSLIRSLKKMEILKLNKKGIFTLTQYSYSFRGRRNKKNAKNRKYNKHKAALKALSIRDNRIYVSELPELLPAQVDIYLDVEGIEDGRFYYLIGLVVDDHVKIQEFSLWADTYQDQIRIINDLIKILSEYKNYRLFHYGSYEIKFFKRSQKVLADENNSISSIMEKCLNLLSIYSCHIYVPVYSNSLKEIAAYFGFKWDSSDISGINIPIWRLKWEINKSHDLREKLIRYNLDDCYALKKLKNFYDFLVSTDKNKSANLDFKEIKYENVQYSSQYKFLINEYALPEIEYLHKCSFFDYQRQRVFVKTDKTIKKIISNKSVNKKKLKINKKIFYSAIKCENCKKKEIVPIRPVAKKIIDLMKSDLGIKRRITELSSHLYKCNLCSHVFLPKRYKKCKERYVPVGYRKVRSKYGHTIMSWVVFQNIVNKQSFRQIESNLYEYFGLKINKSTLHEFKIYIQKYYESTFQALKEKILTSKVLYVDETPFKVKDENGYAWVFTNNHETVSIYQNTREGNFIKDFLENYKGVLVSDFYSAYDSIECAQQKCLIHLIRDMNDELIKVPFDDEFKNITARFSGIMQQIVKTIDKYGLKKRHLNKHKKLTVQYLAELKIREYTSETAKKFQERLIKYHNKIFEFLNHDNVSWNNNSAEHAIKLLATHSNQKLNFFSAARAEEYLKIMSIYQTCVSQDMSFLKFLLSKRQDIKVFNERIKNMHNV